MANDPTHPELDLQLMWNNRFNLVDDDRLELAAMIGEICTARLLAGCDTVHAFGQANG